MRRGRVDDAAPAALFMPGTAARMAWNADDRLMAMMASHFSIGKFLDRRDVLDAGIVDQDVDASRRSSRASAIMSAISAGLVISAGE